ncbi:MAG: hypothetical protein IKJ33_04490 [Clostridia bacterium]|nr:hypothetical protein [Clostridia bacterium]
MQEQFTIRIYDSNLTKKIDNLYNHLEGLYSTKNPFIVECIKKGLEVVEREQVGVRNITSLNELYDEIHQTFVRLNSLIKMSEENAKEIMANLSINQKLLSSNYNMLMGLSEDIPKEPSVVETGHYDELPDRLSEMLEEILQVYLKK